MRIRFLCLFILWMNVFFSPTVQAVSYTSKQIKSYVTHVPINVENKLEDLVEYLIKPFDNDYDKAKAIAFWIASHIFYDHYLSDDKVKALRKIYTGQKPKDLLRSRAGICIDFADLFREMCRIAHIRSVVINGYVCVSGEKKADCGHAWNYFRYKNRNIYVDTTWMAKGALYPKKIVSQARRKRDLRKLEEAVSQKSIMNDFDEYYFNFNYKDERKKYGVNREEKIKTGKARNKI